MPNNDGIKTWKNGEWTRAVVKKWNGNIWEVTEVYSPYYGVGNSDNLNATAKVKTYYPTWVARLNLTREYEWEPFLIDKASTNRATVMECGVNYNSTGIGYSIYIGMPYNSIIQDSLNTFGIAHFETTYTLNSAGSQSAGRPELYAHLGTSMPSVGSPAPDMVMEYYSPKYYGEAWFGADGVETFGTYLENIIEDIALGNAKGIVLSPDYYNEYMWFSISNLKFTVTWASK